MTDMSVIFVVQVIRFIVVSCSQDCHKSRVATALLSNINTPPNQITLLIKWFSKLQWFVRKIIKCDADKNSIQSQALNPLSTTRLIDLETAFPLQKHIKCLLFTRKRKASVFKFLRFEECFRKAVFSWRISVNGRPNRRNKAVFSNFSGVGQTGPKSNKPFRKFSYHRAISSLFQALNIKTDLKENNTSN